MLVSPPIPGLSASSTASNALFPTLYGGNGQQVTSSPGPGEVEPADIQTTNSGARLPKIVRVSVLDTKHPEYLKNYDTWDQLAKLWDGGNTMQNFASSFLVMRPNEPADVYAQRLKRFTYTNNLEAILTWYSAFICRATLDIDVYESEDQMALDTKIGHLVPRKKKTPGPTPAVAPDSTPPSQVNHSAVSEESAAAANPPLDSSDSRVAYYITFRDDVDRAGTDWLMFWRKAIAKLMLYGTYYVLTDKNRISDGIAANRAEAEALGSNKPYLVTYEPLQVTNWKIKSGVLEWIIIKQLVTEQDSPFVPAVTYEQWWYYDTTTWAEYRQIQSQVLPGRGAMGGSKEPLAELYDFGTHSLSTYQNADGTLGKVPVEQLNIGDDGLWFGKRVLLPVINYLNAENELGWLLMQCYVPIPIITGSTNPFTRETNDVGENKYGINVSEHSAILLPEGALFSWSQPDATCANIGMDRMASTMENIYRLLHLQDQGRQGNVIAGQSGYSIALQKMPAREVSRALGSKVQKFMRSTLANIACARGDNTLRFGVRGLTFSEDLSLLQYDEAARLKNLGLPSVTLFREVFKYLARSNKAMEDANDATVAQIEREIDAYVTEEFVQAWVAGVWTNFPGATLDQQAAGKLPKGVTVGPDGMPMDAGLTMGAKGANSPAAQADKTSPIPYRQEMSLISSS